MATCYVHLLPHFAFCLMMSLVGPRLPLPGGARSRLWWSFPRRMQPGSFSSAVPSPPSLSRRHVESRVVPFSPATMCGVVADVAQYPTFVPWCIGANVLSQTPTDMKAELVIGFGPFSRKLCQPRQSDAQ